MSTLRTLAVLLSLVVSTASAVAQGTPGTFTVAVAPPQADLIAIEPFEVARPVTGAPYIAEAVTETTQIFADGNRIERRTSASIARDSRGRVRREHQGFMFAGLMAATPVPLVTISDPATGIHVTLDRERRIAHRVSTPLSNQASRDFNIAVPPGAAAGFLARAGSPDAMAIRTERLGERVVEGVRAEGIRTTMTIEANAIGNQLPIMIASERWYSPELQVVVVTRRSDPRFGETVYRLTDIVRTEPAADLFEIPNDYRIEEQRLPAGVGPAPRF